MHRTASRFSTALPVAAIFVSLLLVSGEARAGGQDIIDRQCSVVNVVDSVEARRYAASVGIMSQDPAVRARLLSRLENPPGAELCALAISQSYCNAEFLEFAVSALTSTMGSMNQAGSAFFTTLGLASTVEDLPDNAGDHTLGILGTVVGGVTGGVAGMARRGEPVIGTLKGGVLGAGIFGSAGSVLDARRAEARCRSVQEGFTSLTVVLLERGLSPTRDDRDLVRKISEIASQLSPEQKQLANEMIEVIGVTVDRID